MSTWIDGTVGGGKLYCRKSPSTSAAAWGRFEDGTKIKVRDVEGHPDWYETYWNNDVSKVGYVIRNYVDAIVMPEDVELTFSKENAIIYAEKHSETTDPGKLCSNRNKTFGSATTNDCANFVSQCLCAGGMPMFKGWSYPVSGIPSGWKKASKWSLTESGMKQLQSKGWISQIKHTEVKRGDIIYTYKSSNADGKKYTHVTLAVSDYKDGHCEVCGHTYNQNHVKKDLTASTCRCYHPAENLIVNRTERRVLLPLEGNGATVIDQ